MIPKKILIKIKKNYRSAMEICLALISVISMVVALFALNISKEANFVAKESNTIAKQANEIASISTTAKLRTSFHDSSNGIIYCKAIYGSGKTYFVLFRYVLTEVTITNKGGLPVSITDLDLGEGRDSWGNLTGYWEKDSNYWPLKENEAKRFPADIEAGKSSLFRILAINEITARSSMQELQDFIEHDAKNEGSLYKPFTWRLFFGNDQVIESSELGNEEFRQDAPNKINDCSFPFIPL